MKTEEIDIIELLRRLWSERLFVLKLTGVVVFLGLVIALFGEVKYKAESIMAPQTGSEMSGRNIQGLAAMAGINLSPSDPSGGLPTNLYPMVVSSVPFQRELMHNTAVTVEGFDAPVTLIEYFTERRYRKFSLFPFLMKYTIGLPGTILKAIRGNDDEASSGSANTGIDMLTVREHECMKLLSKRLNVSVNDRDGYISLSATMPEAIMAAQITSRMQELLQQYIIDFKVQKVQGELDFIEERYNEVKADFEEKQQTLASFQDSHRSLSSAVARTQESRLKNEYDLAFGLYSELASQREQARIRVKEDTPVFTILEPVVVPVERAAPRRARTMMLSLVLGLFIGCAVVFVRDYIGIGDESN